MCFELVVGVVEVAFYGGALDGSVHPFDLIISPWVVWLGKPMLDPMKDTQPVEGMATQARCWPLPILRQIGELDAIVGEHGLDAIWNCLDKCVKERGGGLHIGALHEFNDSELRCAVDGYEQVELALGGPHLGQIDVEEADRIGVELLPARLVPLDLRQAADAMALQTTMKR